MGLIFLDGGPLDGTAYDTKDLLGQPESALPRGYVWTSEKRTSQRTGASAQVWRFVGDSVIPPPPQESAGKVYHPVPALLVEEARASVALDRDQTHVVGEPAATPTERVEETAAYGPQLRVRRKAVGIAAGRLAELAGLKQSRVYAIETGSGKPSTDEERARLDAALVGLEADASAH